jgi:hypothetical protein
LQNWVVLFFNFWNKKTKKWNDEVKECVGNMERLLLIPNHSHPGTVRLISIFIASLGQRF